MIIQNSTLFMEARRTYREENSITERLAIWSDAPPDSKIPNFYNDVLALSKEAKEMLKTKPPEIEEDEDMLLLSLEDRLKIKILAAFIEKLTGQKVRILVPRIPKNPEKMEKILSRLEQLKNKPQSDRAGWGLIYDYERDYSEEETVSFKANGIVKTADGREINFGLHFNISRSFRLKTAIHLRAGDALKDPLVINFGRSFAALGSRKFSFDIDADGREDQVSCLLDGSGFLAIDLNGDNIINDGGELFGPRSGNGFAELAFYDDDKNGWLDENDPVFDRLRIWVKNEKGEDRLLLLGEAGIGAIYLGHINTLFHIKDENNLELGRIRNTGLFLKENGQAGTIQQIDLKI